MDSYDQILHRFQKSKQSETHRVILDPPPPHRLGLIISFRIQKQVALPITVLEYSELYYLSKFTFYLRFRATLEANIRGAVNKQKW